MKPGKLEQFWTVTIRKGSDRPLTLSINERSIVWLLWFCLAVVFSVVLLVLVVFRTIYQSHTLIEKTKSYWVSKPVLDRTIANFEAEGPTFQVQAQVQSFSCQGNSCSANTHLSLSGHQDLFKGRLVAILETHYPQLGNEPVKKKFLPVLSSEGYSSLEELPIQNQPGQIVEFGSFIQVVSSFRLGVLLKPKFLHLYLMDVQGSVVFQTKKKVGEP